jgi:hypothetical protein
MMFCAFQHASLLILSSVWGITSLKSCPDPLLVKSRFNAELHWIRSQKSTIFSLRSEVLARLTAIPL